MVDITKPIRRRDGTDRKVWRVHNVNARYHLISDSGDGCRVDSDDLDNFYENVPEPRKPREWWCNLHVWHSGSSRSMCGYETILECESTGINGVKERIRVIEWPADAPLPEWPKE